MSAELEQAAFEEWLQDKCPSGDVESVQRQWIESHEYVELFVRAWRANEVDHRRQRDDEHPNKGPYDVTH